jgi:hypothetical protein
MNTDFFNRIHVMSAELTTETIQLSCYWATREEGEIGFWGKTIRCWSPKDPPAKASKRLITACVMQSSGPESTYNIA